jgi:hypothetical protein
MQKQILILFCTVASLTIIAGCEKEEAPQPKTKTDLISTGTWKFSTATVSGADVSAFLNTCQKDNILTFSAGGSGTLDEGASKCNAGDPQSNPFTWNFASNETVLHVSTVLFTGGSSDFNIVALSETQLVLSQNITVSGSSQNAVVTFVH